jgi:uncharacterized protein (DUF1778 family)
MTKPAEQKRSRLLSFRMEDENLDSIDRLARMQGISRSQWIRQAMLAELVVELVTPKKPKVAKVATSPPPTEQMGDRPPLQALTREELRAAAEEDERKKIASAAHDQAHRPG